jgi:hypothetical protein
MGGVRESALPLRNYRIRHVILAAASVRLALGTAVFARLQRG